MPGLLEIEKSWKKRVSECNSVAIKTTKIIPFWKLKALTHPTCLLIWEWIIVAHTTAVSQNGIWHVYFFYILKYLRNPLLNIYAINLLKPYLFQSLNETGSSVGLRQTNENIFEPQEDLNYFDKFMRLTQNRIFEIASIS